MSASNTSDEDQNQDRILNIESKGTPFFYEWIIPRFYWAPFEYQSQTFTPQNSASSEFRLILNPEHQSDSVLCNEYKVDSKGIEVIIEMVSTPRKSLKIEMLVHFCIFLENTKNEYTNLKNMRMTSVTPITDILEFSSTNRHFRNVTFNSYSYGNYDGNAVFFTSNIYNTLTVQCTGKLLTHYGQPHEEIKTTNCSILNNYSTMLYSETFADVTLAVDGNEIPAHKVILAAQSSVFAAMFQHDTTESRQNRVVVTDINHLVLKEMLRFVYTGETPHLDTMAGELLTAADKYALESLKTTCEQYLLENISIETACHTLLLADMHSAKLLKEKAIDYITEKNRVMNIMNSAAWKEISSTHPHVIVEAFQVIATKQQPTLFMNPQ